MIFKDAVLYKARVLYVKKQYVLRCHFNGRQRSKILHISHMKINFVKISDSISLFSYLRLIWVLFSLLEKKNWPYKE